MMSFKCSNRCKIVFDPLWLSYIAVNTEFICKVDIKFQYVSRAVCAYAHDFGNDQDVRLLENVR